MADAFDGDNKGTNTPATKAFAVTPHDTNELAAIPTQVHVGGVGDVALIMQDDSVAVILLAVPAGTTLNIRPKIIKSTGTSATSIIGLY